MCTSNKTLGRWSMWEPSAWKCQACTMVFGCAARRLFFTWRSRFEENGITSVFVTRFFMGLEDFRWLHNFDGVLFQDCKWAFQSFVCEILVISVFLFLVHSLMPWIHNEAAIIAWTVPGSLHASGEWFQSLQKTPVCRFKFCFAKDVAQLGFNCTKRGMFWTDVA